MFRRLLTLLLFLPLACTAAIGPDPVRAQAHASTHHIKQSTFTDGDACSATAVGPHVLLIATHCELPSNVILVDHDQKASQIYKIVRDSRDHSLLYVDRTFTAWSEVDEHAQLYPGDKVFIFGNPGQYEDLFREGTFAYDQPEMEILIFIQPGVHFYNLDIYFGDSGAGIFNAEGKVVDVVSFISVNQTTFEDKTIYSFKLCGAYPLSFPDKILHEAQQWSPPAVVK